MAIAALVPLSGKDWDARKARHLLNRAGFGIPRERVAHLAKLSPRDAVSAMVDFDAVPGGAVERPEFVITPAEAAAIRKADTKNENELNKAERRALNTLRVWWLGRMFETRRPLEEKLALFWHGHFATSAQKVRSSMATFAIYDVFRTHATGNFKDLTLAVAKSPSMLRYLDNNRNLKGRPNENWARELMELFTIGVGNYTEQDIKESARAFTGWTYSRQGFVFRDKQHDFGTKTFMGRTGDFDGVDIIDILFEQPETAEFIVRKLWAYFVYDDPEAEIVTALAAEFRDSGYEIEPLLRTIFSSRAFYSERAMGTQIKSPAQFVVQLAYDLRLENPPYPEMTQMAARIGQNLLHPPNVKGWDGGRAWINANTLLLRYNMPANLVRAANNQKPGGNKMMGQSMNDMAMAPKAKTRREQFQEYMEAMPATERQQMRNKLKAAKDKNERYQMMQAALRTRPLSAGPWEPASLVEQASFSTAGECVDALARQLLARPLDPKQRAIIANALADGGASASLSPESLNDKRLAGAIHLMLSTAEYQLC